MSVHRARFTQIRGVYKASGCILCFRYGLVSGGDICVSDVAYRGFSHDMSHESTAIARHLDLDRRPEAVLLSDEEHAVASSNAHVIARRVKRGLVDGRMKLRRGTQGTQAG